MTRGLRMSGKEHERARHGLKTPHVQSGRGIRGFRAPFFFLRIFQHTPGTYPRPPTNSLWRFLSFGDLGVPGVCSKGMLGFSYIFDTYFGRIQFSKWPETVTKTDEKRVNKNNEINWFHVIYTWYCPNNPCMVYLPTSPIKINLP